MTQPCRRLLSVSVAFTALYIAIIACGVLTPRLAEAQDSPVAPARSAQAEEVLIPNFWDPRRRVERPPQGAIPVLRFITTDDYPPFNFLDSNGRLTGFNVDLARAICAELGIRCTIQSREWEELTDRVLDKTADAIITGIAVNAANRQQLDFSDAYLRLPGRFISLRENAEPQLRAADLAGSTVGVVEGTAHAAYLAATWPAISTKAYPDADAARRAVKTGEVEAHFGDGLQLSFWLESEAADGCCTFSGGPYLESHFFGEGLAIAFPKGQSGDLKRALNAALQALHEKGVYAELYLRYFPVGFF